MSTVFSPRRWLGILALAAACAGSAPALIHAQANPTPKGATVKPNVAADLKITPLRLQKLPARTFVPAQGKATMDGWTALTDTATLGGASLYSFEGHAGIVTTGGDGGLYIASFNPAAPAAVTAWSFQPGGLVSEPHCKPFKRQQDQAGQYRIACVGLTAAGAAKAVELRDTGGFGYDFALDLGGKSGPDAPNFVGDPHEQYLGYAGYGQLHFEFDTGVTVNGALWVSRYRDDIGAGAWSTVAGAFRATPVTSSENLFTPTAKGTAIQVLPVVPTPVIPVGSNLPPPYTLKAAVATSPLAGVALSGEMAAVTVQSNLVVVVARGEDAQLYQIAFDTKNNAFIGSWKADGGVVPAHTWPSCVAANQKPVCVIQGADGKLYAKTLQAGGAL